MPVTPVAGVPPQATLNQFRRNTEQSPAFAPSPLFDFPGTPKSNFYTQNGQIILAAIVVILLIIFFFIDTVGKISSGFFF